MAKKMKDADLVAMLAESIRQAVGYNDSRLSRERLELQKYYDGDLPKPLHAGNSKYVSTDVWDGVESMKAQLLEVFSGNSEPVKFAPQGEDDIEKAQQATDYANYVVFRQNPGFAIMRDAMHDGLMFRAGIVKVWWENLTDEVAYEISETTYEALEQYLMANPDAKPTEIEWAGPAGSAIKRVSLIIPKDKSQVRIKNMPPEEFFISSRAVSLGTAELCGHRYRETYSGLLKAGYDKKLVDKLQAKDDLWLVQEEELVERHEQTSDTAIAPNDASPQDARKTIQIYECYCELDDDGDGTSHLYQVIYAGDQVLRKERVNRIPFLAFVPLPRPHAFYGTNFAALLIAVQNSRTALTRSIIDHALITNNPRYGVVQGGLTNPKELMDNRIGGLVNVRRPDAIFPLPQAGLNPFVFQTIQQIDSDKEQRIGISRLSQGLSKDAISKQNSAQMVDQLITVSQTRQKIVARNFAEGFLTDLYKEVYRLIVENETEERIVAISGGFVRVDPTSWPERDDLIVQFALGYGEQEKEASKYADMDKLLSADPRLARMYPETVRHQVISKAMKGFGISDIKLVDPKTLPPPEPDPMAIADLELKKADAEVKKATAQATVEKLKLDMLKEQNRHSEAMAKLQQHGAVEAEKADLGRDKLAHTVAVDAVQMTLQAKAAETGDLTAQADPTD